jgi:hypothetical protein
VARGAAPNSSDGAAVARKTRRLKTSSGPAPGFAGLDVGVEQQDGGVGGDQAGIARRQQDDGDRRLVGGQGLTRSQSAAWSRRRSGSRVGIDQALDAQALGAVPGQDRGRGWPAGVAANHDPDWGIGRRPVP